MSAPTDTPAPTEAELAASRFDTKVAVLLRDDRAVWQQLNVAAFLVSGIISAVEGIIGKPCRSRHHPSR